MEGFLSVTSNRRVALVAFLVLLAVAVMGCSNLHNRVDEALSRSAGSDLPPKVSLQPADGGDGYYSKFKFGSVLDDPEFFPLGTFAPMWPSVDTKGKYTLDMHIALDKAAGINLYVNPGQASSVAEGPDQATAVRNSGMKVIGSLSGAEGEEIVGRFIDDEADMRLGSGSGPYNPSTNTCSSEEPCGYTAEHYWASALPSDGRLRWVGYGKGVAFWHPTDEVAQWLNGNSDGTPSWPVDITGANVYWFVDSDLKSCSQGGWLLPVATECPGELTNQQVQLGANYGAVIAKQRSLIQPINSRPVFGYVELFVGGRPDVDGYPRQIQAAEIRSAVWHSIIAGARGIVYFDRIDQSADPFGATASSIRCGLDPDYQGAWSNPELRAGCHREWKEIISDVALLNQQVTSLAPVINAPSAVGYVDAAGDVMVTARHYDGHFYILAGSGSPGVSPPDNQTVTFSISGATSGTVTVIDENRTLDIRDGRFTDTFETKNSYHIYRVE
jgi:hypothetical protein